MVDSFFPLLAPSLDRVVSATEMILNTNEKRAMALAFSILVLSWMISVVRRRILTMFACTHVPFWARLLAPIIRKYSFSERRFFSADKAPPEVAAKRRRGFQALSDRFRTKFSASNKSIVGLSDIRFTNANRVPFPFQHKVQTDLPCATVVTETKGPQILDIDGNWSLDLSGSYGVNVAGHDRYKIWMKKGLERVSNLGPVLGPLHPVVLENVSMLTKITGLDEVSFHMSGTEAVMCAVRLARLNTKRRLIVQFGGAYHGWWDGVQPGPGNERNVDDVITMKDMSRAALSAIRARGPDIAAVIVNPFQAFHPNAPPPSDLVLMSNKARNTLEGGNHPYGTWLKELKAACAENSVPLVFDEVYSGFRMCPGGGAEYFGVQPDMIVYGKTLGGGLPVGAVCGKSKLMQRYDPFHPLRVAYVIGTFSAAPAVMGAMNEFLKWVTTDEAKECYKDGQARFDRFVASTNAALQEENLPIKINNLTTVFTFQFTTPSRYHWMFQYYLRDQHLNLSWVGTGRCIVSLDFTDEHYATLQHRIVAAAKQMREDGFWPQHGEKPTSNLAQGIRMAKEMAYSTIVSPLTHFYDDMMEQKEIDHHASHSHLINQFLHLISSLVFLWCYQEVVRTGDWSWPIQLGLISLCIRQLGHYIFEPPCHDAEQAMLGFDTQSKVKIVILYGLVFGLFAVAHWNNWNHNYRLTDAWLLCTTLIVYGRVGVLWRRFSFSVSMHWWVKFMTDPITDIPAYWQASYKILDRRRVIDAVAKSFPEYFPNHVPLKFDQDESWGMESDAVKRGLALKGVS